MIEKDTILIVDDESADLIALDGMLCSDGRRLIRAYSGKEVLEILSKEKIDLILLDVQMPDMNGFELVKQLKSNQVVADIPVIFVSAEKPDHASLLKGLEEGAVDYLFKPLNVVLTKAKVNVLLEARRQKAQLVQATRQLEKANLLIDSYAAQLEAANKELASFSYSVSHDLRAPLRALYGNAQALEEDFGERLDGEAKKYLSRIRENSSRLDRLINDLLAFSRIGKKGLRKNAVNMNDMVQDVFIQLSETQSHKAVLSTRDLPDAFGDYSMLHQVWSNLISNAIKYSSKKNNPAIEIGGCIKDGRTEYYIRDNGAGFDMAYAGKLFGTFQRLHDSSDFEGVGIGLAIAQRIILKHGGTIRAEAIPEEGATFIFSLPADTR